MILLYLDSWWFIHQWWFVKHIGYISPISIHLVGIAKFLSSKLAKNILFNHRNSQPRGNMPKLMKFSFQWIVHGFPPVHGFTLDNSAAMIHWSKPPRPNGYSPGRCTNPTDGRCGGGTASQRMPFFWLKSWGLKSLFRGPCSIPIQADWPFFFGQYVFLVASPCSLLKWSLKKW